MAIYVPGIRHKRGARPQKRSAVAVLSLTAMVDMFTVLVIFLLQNYAVTGAAIEISNDVNLPRASSTKQLRPSNAVVVSKKTISFNNEIVEVYNKVRLNEEWILGSLRKKVEQSIQEGEKEKQKISSKIKAAVGKSKKDKEEVDDFRKITIQSDETVDFLTLKKVMYTVTQAGIYEINFAVLKKLDEEI